MNPWKHSNPISAVSTHPYPHKKTGYGNQSSGWTAGNTGKY